MIIGNFKRAGDGYIGRIRTMQIDADLRIVPAQPGTADKAPDWRVMIGEGEDAAEVGAGWNHVGKRAGDYIALQIDDPALPRTLRANLLRSVQEDIFHLLWSRPSRAKKPA